MSRHVWVKKSAKVKACKYCNVEKRAVKGKNGGNRTGYAAPGKEETTPKPPECIDKGKVSKPKVAKIAKTSKVVKDTKKTVVVPRNHAGNNKYEMLCFVAYAPLLYHAESAAINLGLKNVAELYAAVEAGNLRKPMEGNRWTKQDLNAYVSRLESRRSAEEEAGYRAAEQAAEQAAEKAKVEADAKTEAKKVPEPVVTG